MADRVRIDVAGQEFTISRTSLENGNASRLTEMYKSTKSPKSLICRLVVDRPAEMFSAILAMYQTGELHIPMTSCPGAFASELVFWDIPTEALSPCCYNRLQSFLDEQETLKQFRESLEDDSVQHQHNESSPNRLQEARSKIWNIVEYRKFSLPAKIYFILSLAMVLLSICVLAVKTDDNFRRAMTNCERLEYMISSGMEDVHLVEKTLERYCDKDTLPNQPKMHTLLTHEKAEEYDYYTYFYFSDDDGDSENETVQYDDFSIPLNSTGPQGLQSRQKGQFVKVPNMKVKVFSLYVLETITLVFFTVELIVRLFACPNLKLYFLSIVNITDALALLCTYVHFVLMFVHEHERYRDSWVDLLEYTQMLRALRLFRIVANLRAGKVLAYSIRANLKDLSILALFLISGMCTFASCLYIAEDKNDVKSILNGWYWAVVTMTTVGYGDISPKTSVGRTVACLCAITGVLLFALTLPIFANHFLSLYQHADTKHAFKESRKDPALTDNGQGHKDNKTKHGDKKLIETI